VEALSAEESAYRNTTVTSVTTIWQRKTDLLGRAAGSFNLDGQTVDVLDLKTLLITRGINVPEEITG